MNNTTLVLTLFTALMIIATAGLSGCGVGPQQNIDQRAPETQALMASASSYYRGPVHGGTYTPRYTHLPSTATEDRGYINTLKNPASSFATDVDTASNKDIQRYLDAGQRPPSDAIRQEELVNHFAHKMLRNDSEGVITSSQNPVGIFTEIFPHPFHQGYELLRITLHSHKIPVADRPPVNLVLLADTSGSMESPEKLPNLKRALNKLALQLNKGDRISLVTYAGGAQIQAQGLAGNDPALLELSSKLNAQGNTNGAEGLKLAYKVAKAEFIDPGINRILWISDGDLNSGLVDIDSLSKKVRTVSGHFNIQLSTLGLGFDNYNASLLEQLAKAGNGSHAYAAHALDVEKFIAKNMGQALTSVAEESKIKVEFNPEAVAAYRLIGYDDNQLTEQQFADQRTNAGEIGSGQTVTALYELILTDSPLNTREYGYGAELGFSPQTSANTSKSYATVSVAYKNALQPGKPWQHTQAAVTNQQRPNPFDRSYTSSLLASVISWSEKLLHSEHIDSATSWDALKLSLSYEIQATNNPKHKEAMLELLQLIYASEKVMPDWHAQDECDIDDCSGYGYDLDSEDDEEESEEENKPQAHNHE